MKRLSPDRLRTALAQLVQRAGKRRALEREAFRKTSREETGQGREARRDHTIFRIVRIVI